MKNSKCSGNGMCVAIYTRVSTKEQNTSNQIEVLNQYCKSRMYEVYKVYDDIGVSGSKESRPEFDLMLLDAGKRKFDCILVWKLDRLSRSLKHLLTTLDTLSSLNISFISYNDNMDTTTSTGKLMFSIIGAFAEFERSLISERVCLGLQRAKKHGKQLGRPKLAVNKYKILNMRNHGKSIREIAKKLSISIGSVHKTISKI